MAGGQSHLVPMQPNWGSRGVLPEARTKALVRKDGSQPAGQRGERPPGQHTSTVKVSVISHPASKIQSRAGLKTVTSWRGGKSKSGGKKKFPSCACYRGVTVKWYESGKMFGSNTSNAGKAQTRD